MDCMGNALSEPEEVAAVSTIRYLGWRVLSVAVGRVAEGGDEDEVVGGFGCH